VLPFTKMQALGNDFIALNGFAGLPLPDEDLQPYRDLAIRLCDRHFGIGADGLFVALPSQTADARMLFFNPDGSEDRCGNGLRCFGRFLHDNAITRKAELRVETYGGTVQLQVCREGARVAMVRVDLGLPVLDAPRIPANLPPGPALNVPLDIGGKEWRVTCVSTGTPHAVLPVTELPDDETFLSVSPRIETHPLFPEKISVMWTKFISPSEAEIRIWERVTGETLGCGTGAAAVAVAGRLLGRTEGPIHIRSKGGVVEAHWAGEGTPITLTGPAESVFEGVWKLEVGRWKLEVGE
jgi:diaminopimelate epimerase